MAIEEVYGPVLPVWRVSDLDEAVERANASRFALGASIWTRDLDAGYHALRRLRAGYAWINTPQKVYDELPFSGHGQSGLGRENGVEALDSYTETTSVVVRRAHPQR